MKYLFIIFLFLVACKKPENNSPKAEVETHKQTHKNISIDRELFHLKVDGRNNPEKNVDVLGQYVIDRFGKAKKAVFLDGISDVIEIKNQDDLNPEEALTIAIWYKPDSYKGNGSNAIVWKGYPEYKKPYAQYLFSATGNLYPNKFGVFKFGLSINGKLNQIQTKNNFWTADKWYHLTGTYDGHKMKFYINGKLVNQRAVTGTLDVYNTPLLIGKTLNKEFYTSGVFDDFRLFDKALTLAEINLLAQEK